MINEWRQICAGYINIHVCNAVGDPIIYREKVGITLTGFNTATCLCLPQARPGFPMIMFNDFWREAIVCCFFLIS